MRADAAQAASCTARCEGATSTLRPCSSRSVSCFPRHVSRQQGAARSRRSAASLVVLTPCCVARTRLSKSSVASLTILRRTGAFVDMSGDEFASSSQTPGEGAGRLGSPPFNFSALELLLPYSFQFGLPGAAILVPISIFLVPFSIFDP